MVQHFYKKSIHNTITIETLIRIEGVFHLYK